MKKLFFIVLCITFTVLSYGQKESGVVYAEHESIDQTRALWEAFQNGDIEAYKSFFADTVYVIVNGELLGDKPVKREEMGTNVTWWNKEVANLEVVDHKPAYPDAIKYGNDAIWVQDWIKFKGIHKESGIKIDMPMHNLYSFDADGKIASIHFYFNNDVMEEIRNASRKIENGKVYINHPYIATVRKIINAIESQDYEELKSYYAPDAKISGSNFMPGETMDFETRAKNMKAQWEKGISNIYKQQGYPDCIYYAKNDQYVVYSWWTVKHTDGEKVTVFPLMLSHSFNKEGKVVFVHVYMSTNHFD